MPHHRSTRSLGILLVGLSVLSACAANNSALEPERTEPRSTVESIDPLTTNSTNPDPALQQESSSTVESVDPPTTNPINPATSLHGVEPGMNDSSDDTETEICSCRDCLIVFWSITRRVDIRLCPRVTCLLQ